MSRARSAAIAVLLATWLPPALARAADDPECATAYAKGQDDRLAGRLYDARTAFQRCAAATCPQAVASDCATWAAEVEADLPTVVLQVTDSHGRALPDVRAFADGAPLDATALTRPLVLEAGPHSLRFEAPGYESATVQTALRPTDRELPVRATLYTVVERAPQAAPEAPARPSRPIPVLSVALAGLGVVALGTSAYFGVSARRQYDDLERTCAPSCPRGDVDEVETKALVSDLALATSVVALGAAAWVFFGAPDEPRTALVLSSSPRGADASLRVTF